MDTQNKSYINADKKPYDITLYIRAWNYKAFIIAVTVNSKEYEIYDDLEELNKFPPNWNSLDIILAMI